MGQDHLQGHNLSGAVGVPESLEEEDRRHPLPGPGFCGRVGPLKGKSPGVSSHYPRDGFGVAESYGVVRKGKSGLSLSCLCAGNDGVPQAVWELLKWWQWRGEAADSSLLLVTLRKSTRWPLGVPTAHTTGLRMVMPVLLWTPRSIFHSSLPHSVLRLPCVDLITQAPLWGDTSRRSKAGGERSQSPFPCSLSVWASW